MDPLDKLQFEAAALLIELQDLKGVTQGTVNTVMSGVNRLFEGLLDVVSFRFQTKCSPDDALSLDEISAVIQGLRGQNAFEGVQSRDRLDAFMNKHHMLIKPQIVELKTKEVLKGASTVNVPVEWAYYVPFLPSLQQVLNCPDVLNCVDHPLPHKPGRFQTALDGAYYQSHPLVLENPPVLGIGIYTDGVEMTDSASSKSGAHGLTFVYWVLYNIHPDKRSSIRSVFLLAVVKTSWLKIHGYSKLLADFIQVMNRLSSADGIPIKLSNGIVRIFHGLFINSSGDNPASSNLGGYKESAAFAAKPCRQCYVSREELYSSFKEADFELRTKLKHDAQVQEIEQYRDNPIGPDPSVVYGINQRSVLMSIDGCDVTKCLPQDVMHDVLEGTLKLDMCCTLNHVIERKSMSLNEINNRIRLYSKFIGENKPSKIDPSHLQKGKLKLTASEAWNLAYILPFVLRKKNFITGKMESACDAKNLLLLILRLNLMDLLLSDELKLTDVHRIRQLTETHHLLFQDLYHGKEIPKMHYEVHFGTHILLYGPPRQFWCFRFEAKHAFFKRRFRLYRCLKNHAKSLSLCHQRYQCGAMLLSMKGNAGPFLQSSDRCGASVGKQLILSKSKNLLESFFHDLSSYEVVLEMKIAICKGVTYRRKSVIITHFDKTGPVFGKIIEIVQVQQKLMFIYQKLNTVHFVNNLNAFKVKHTAEKGLILAQGMLYHHNLPFIQAVGSCYVVVPCKSYLSSLDFNAEAMGNTPGTRGTF